MRLFNRAILETELDIVIAFIDKNKLQNNYNITETKSGTIILYLYTSDKKWQELNYLIGTGQND